MAFRFPLATVLRVRETIEKREERALQKVQLEVALVTRQIEELDVRILKAQDAREEALKQSIHAVHLQSMLEEIQAAGDLKNNLLDSLQKLELRREQQVKLYQIAHRDREMLTDMQHQQRDAYEIERARAQQKTLDDIFMARHHRR
jgi:flagellar export protein FliJ